VQGGVLSTADRNSAGAYAENLSPVFRAEFSGGPGLPGAAFLANGEAEAVPRGCGRGGGCQGKVQGHCLVSARVLLRVRMEGRGSGGAGAARLVGSTVGRRRRRRRRLDHQKGYVASVSLATWSEDVLGELRWLGKSMQFSPFPFPWENLPVVPGGSEMTSQPRTQAEGPHDAH